MRSFAILAFAGLAAGLATGANAAEVHVAVAANFTDAANDIAAAFQEATGDDAILSFGSTGQLYTQIAQGAPFDVFLAADQERPQMAVENGLALADSEFTYAIGQIVLWSTDPDLVAGEQTLTDASFDKLAIANPITAPYGAAAVEAMQALGVYDALQPKIVQGNDIAQTHQFIATGNAALGFVALSQLAGDESGSRWIVPQALYNPIRQDAVLLETAADNAAAAAFMDFLKGPEAGAIIERYGYVTDAAD